jgi:hypothetical protein
MAHLAVPYGVWQDARLEPKYILYSSKAQKVLRRYQGKLLFQAMTYLEPLGKPLTSVPSNCTARPPPL